MLHRDVMRISVFGMCRSSTTSIGFLLLLWIGIVIPAAEQQLAHLADDPGAKSAFDTASAADDRYSTKIPAGHADGVSSPSGASNPDLTDITLPASAPAARPVSQPFGPARVVDRIWSRQLPPQERPPKHRAA